MLANNAFTPTGEVEVHSRFSIVVVEVVSRIQVSRFLARW
jgi:hypothetical protein